MEDNLKDPLEELADAMAREFGLGLKGGIVIGAVVGITGAITARKVTDLIIRRQKAKEAKQVAKLSKKD